MTFLKKLAAALVAFGTIGSSLCAQSEIIGNDAPENFAWPAPKTGDMTFRFISLDGAPRVYYVQVGDFFAPVEMAGKQLGHLYAYKKSDEVVFYDRKPVTDPTLKGKAIFTQAFKVQTGGSSDIYIPIFAANGKISAKAIDVSLERMPIGSFAIINLSPTPQFFTIARNAVRVNFLESSVYSMRAGKTGVIGVPLEIYVVENGKYVLSERKRYSFAKDERTVVLVYSIQKLAKSMGVFSLDETKASKKGAAPVGSVSNIVFITNRGPRY